MPGSLALAVALPMIPAFCTFMWARKSQLQLYNRKKTKFLLLRTLKNYDGCFHAQFI
jgi:hypothetical protein